MSKRSKTPKTYRVRVVNPSRPGAPRFMGESNPAERKVIATSKDRYKATAEERRRYGGSTVTEFYVRYADEGYSNMKVITGYGKTPGERKTDAIKKFRQHESTAANPNAPKHGATKRTGNYRLRYVEDQNDPPMWGHIMVLYTGKASGGEEAQLEYYVDRELLETDWAGARGDDDVAILLAEHGYDEYGNSLSGRRNPKGHDLTARERKVLEQLRDEAEESEDDWGITDGVRDYLKMADAGPVTDTPRQFLTSLHEDVWYNFGHTGEEGEGADPFYGRASANRAAQSIRRAEQRLGAQRNPKQGHGVAKVRNPDLRADATSVRARALSRRISGAGS